MNQGRIIVITGAPGTGKTTTAWAKHKNLHGLMLETQDNNLIACKFYHNCGFKIGSVDTMLYANFENNFEKAVFWYLRF
jgi:deoxyadenosine/deoxycytidine kinase